MWEEHDHRTATATARPVRVAYLVALSDCPDELLDAIFAEAYGRWGGRRTLIVPATADGIDDQYAQWLRYFDADVIYSFVALSDVAVEEIHERYAPAYLNHHKDINTGRGKRISFRVRLPFEGLSSLSVLPAFVSRSWSFDGRPTSVTVLDKYADRSESRFLQENFGFLSKSFTIGLAAAALPEFLRCLTLITAELLAERHLGTDKHDTYETDEDAILAALGQRNWLLPLVNLSEMFGPYLYPLRTTRDGMNIVAGDTPADRLLFWNGHHSFARVGFSEITSLRIPEARLDDVAFIKRIREIIEQRGVRRYDGRNDSVTLRSCSLSQENLEAVAKTLRKAGHWLAVGVKGHLHPSSCVPHFAEARSVVYMNDIAFGERVPRATTEFRGNRLAVPKAKPWHIDEASPPVGMREGNWMVDLTIERQVSQSQYRYQQHVWALPRRLRIERAFKLEREPETSEGLPNHFIRPMRTGALGLALGMHIQSAVVTTPEDIDALRLGINNEVEWQPFDRNRKNAPVGRQRVYTTEISDKGRYLLGVLQLFDSLPSAFDVLMDGFWRDILQRLGTSPTDQTDDLSAFLIRTLRKRLNQRTGPLRFESDEELERLAQEAIRAGRMVRRERRYIPYGELKQEWMDLVQQWLDDNPGPSDDDESYYHDERHLVRSVQYLCECEVLFQGRAWQCRTCFNRNWVGIETLGRRMTCEVCGRNESAPVSGDWHFRANPFVLDAYREHGTEALVWALWQLCQRAERSFYFAPSLKLWLSPAKDDLQCNDVEIDAAVVVDGDVYLVEATTARGLSGPEIKRLAVAAERIRPDVVFVACMADTDHAVTRLKRRLRAELPPDARVEVYAFRPDALERAPLLPH